MRTVKVMWDTEAHPKFNRLRFVVQMRKQVAIEKLWPTSFDACVCVCNVTVFFSLSTISSFNCFRFLHFRMEWFDNKSTVNTCVFSCGS